MGHGRDRGAGARGARLGGLVRERAWGKGIGWCDVFCCGWDGCFEGVFGVFGGTLRF
jgi:hypothetical protein